MKRKRMPLFKIHNKYFYHSRHCTKLFLSFQMGDENFIRTQQLSETEHKRDSEREREREREGEGERERTENLNTILPAITVCLSPSLPPSTVVCPSAVQPCTNDPFHLKQKYLMTFLMKRDVTSGVPFVRVWSAVCMRFNGDCSHV